MCNAYKLIDKLAQDGILAKDEWITLINDDSPATSAYLFEKARFYRHKYYGNTIYLRGLIEISNYCKNDCLYCGIRKSNRHACRYRLTKEEILDCCQTGYEAGYRSFVLQGGEDGYFTDDRIVDLVRAIKTQYSDCAVTLSIGEKSDASYQRFWEAGVDRYLLRHETANETHYQKLHPATMTLQNRKRCLYTLKKIGFQTGCGFMVGSPFQETANLAEDMLFMHELQPQMVGIGPFIPHDDTPFRDKHQGSFKRSLFMLGLVRVMMPKVLLPATTALATIAEEGQIQGILAGANVIMPNLSPISVRAKYQLYNHKKITGSEAAEYMDELKERMHKIGYQIVCGRGDYIGTDREE